LTPDAMLFIRAKMHFSACACFFLYYLSPLGEGLPRLAWWRTMQLVALL
jgi:hypothetical protein